MILFNEPHKFKWNIIYETIDLSNKTEIVALGKNYDFIPEKGNVIIIDEIIYSVTNKIYDFDKSNIVISLNILKK